MKNVKRFPAFLAAFGITAIIGMAILVVGANALLNPHPAEAQSSTDSQAVASTTATSAELQQLQDTLSQYQAQLSQANYEIQQYQALLVALQNQGVIQINNDGTISIPRGGSSFRGGDGD
jgi:predicted Rossmann fold nucleotide-binding protein DprA/Smf involved in DNA uptake